MLQGRMLLFSVLVLFSLVDPAFSANEACLADFNNTIAAGEVHTIGLREDGLLMGAGDNSLGKLNISGWSNIKAVAAGDGHTVGLREDGTVVAVGDHWEGQLQVSGWSNIKAVAAGMAHTVGLREDGTVVAVGLGWYGQLNVSGWSNIKAVAAGAGHTVGLREDGTVVAVGINEHGQLNVSGWSNIKAVAAGAGYTVGLKEDGTVVAVGNPGYGELQVSGWSNIKAVAAGKQHTVGLREDGTVVAVGNNNRSQLNVSGWSNIKAVAAGGFHTVGLKEDGTVVAVGLNNLGQLNVSDWNNIKLPSGVQDMTPPVTIAEGVNDGWQNKDVSISFSVVDDCSGVKTTEYSFDGTTWTRYSYPLAITDEGTTTVYYKSTDNAGNVETTKSISVNIDKTSPIISASVGPTPAPNGWNNSDVTVTFTCSDSVSGIATCPLPVVVTTEGAGQIVSGAAVDNAGNTTAALVTLNVDKTPPVIAVTGVTNGATYAIGLVPVASYSVTDDLSGVAVHNAAFTGGDGYGLGTFNYTVNATDNAGNSATSTVVYTVIATADGLIALVQQMLSSGQIDNAGVANSLIAKIENVMNAPDDKTVDNIMQAFINQVSAQAGNHISQDAAAILINAATYIINN